MNYRLLSPGEIQQNKKRRASRRNATKRARRAEAYRKDLVLLFHATMQATCGQLNPEEAWTFLHGNAREVRRVVRKVKYQMEVLNWPVVELPQLPDSELIEVERPVRTLQAHRRGRSPTSFSAPPIDISDAPRLGMRFKYLTTPEVRERFLRCPCRLRVMQAVFRLSSYPSWDDVMSDTNRYKLTDPEITEAEVEKAREACQYPGPYDEAREAYASIVAAWNVPVAKGDWGARLAADLERIRPGLRVPKRLQRDVYLINFVDSQYGEPREMDFYSIRYQPLFRLTLEPRPYTAPDPSPPIIEAPPPMPRPASPIPVPTSRLTPTPESRVGKVGYHEFSRW